MEINVLAFGQVADITGKTSWKVPLVKTTNELNQQLIKSYPQLQSTTYLIAVNKKIIQESVELNTDDTVALLPPFSGG
ncbi:MAG: hypothetical protein OJF59_002289 [Cytophagales bacterium]|jgi:molybdopterin synthase sulfur carrier subunit|nr:MoaD/ThiS family protein [Bacteroidota bacterium]MBS1981529.1 MoaD/ThiS family protein [Bacteroidota bacterium]WHZ08535.1 MAG: hypothetical protein OJF59_002289 [Cytophagales bacterium]